MTSRERVIAALSNQEPDRVPIGYEANPGIDARLKEHFGLASDDDEGLLRALNVDFRRVEAPYTGPRIHPELPDRRVDSCFGMRARWIEHESGAYWDYCDFPLRNATVEEVKAWPMPSPDHFDYDCVPEACKRHDGYAIYVGDSGFGCIINMTGLLFGMEDTLVGLLTEDPALLNFTDRMLAITGEVVRRTIEAAKGRIDFVWMGEDLGTQINPIISLDLFRKQIRPRHQKIIDMAKSFNLPVMLHTCGSSSWAYEDYIEMGLSAVQTLQPEAKDMFPAYLKRTFGGRLAFHGCVSTAGPVAFGTVDEVVEDCRRTLDIMMPEGGYCFAPTHCLQDNSPTENVIAMYETGLRCGRY